MKHLKINFIVIGVLYIISIFLALIEGFSNNTLEPIYRIVFLATILIGVINISSVILQTNVLDPYRKTAFVAGFINLYILVAILLSTLGLSLVFLVPHVLLVIYFLKTSETDKTMQVVMFLILIGSLVGSALYTLLPESTEHADMLVLIFSVLLVLHILCCSLLKFIKHLKSKS